LSFAQAFEFWFLIFHKINFTNLLLSGKFIEGRQLAPRNCCSIEGYPDSEPVLRFSTPHVANRTIRRKLIPLQA
jgi:hypothetical protein